MSARQSAMSRCSLELNGTCNSERYLLSVPAWSFARFDALPCREPDSRSLVLT